MAQQKKRSNKDLESLISNLSIECPSVHSNHDRSSHHRIDYSDIIPMVDEKYCNICGEKNRLFQCSRCCVLCYCCKDHQIKDWSSHKTQCMILSHINDDLSQLRHLYIPDGARLIGLKNPFPSLHHVTNWYTVWKHLQCTLFETDIFQKLMSELLSWPLTLANGICRFKLDQKDHIQVHVLGANDSFIKLGLFTYLLEYFPLPNTDIFLIGPQLSHFMSPVSFENIAGKLITVSCISDVFDQQYDNFNLPDLIIAFHPDIRDENYDWKPTLLYIVSKEIPSVFTSCCKEDFDDILSLLHCELLNTNIIFNGSSPFPSMLKKYTKRKWNEYSIKVMNSYWIGFRGNSLTTEAHGLNISRSVSELCNLSFTDLEKVFSPVADETLIDLGKCLIPSLLQFQFSDALVCFNDGLKKYESGDDSGSLSSFQNAVLKAKLPDSKLFSDGLIEGKELCEKKMKSVLASSYMYLGLLCKKQNDLMNAIQEIKKAVEVDDTFHVAYYNLGVLYQDIGDFNGMEEAFSNATRLSPKDFLSWNGLGDALYGNGKVAEAKGAYTHAEKLQYI